MIDLHTHILPNIDDGAGSLEEALRMTKELKQQNITAAVCTPHFYPTKQSLQDFIDKRSAAIGQMGEAAIKLYQGSETVLHDYLFHYPDLGELCLEGTDYMLIELPFYKTWDRRVYQQLDHMINYYGIRPMIAHIERYPAFQKNERLIYELIQMGCFIQMNTGALVNKKSRSKALSYLKKGYIDVISSDCHNMSVRPPDFKEAIEVIISKFGMKEYNRLEENAQKIIKSSDKEERANK